MTGKISKDMETSDNVPREHMAEWFTHVFLHLYVNILHEVLKSKLLAGWW